MRPEHVLGTPLSPSATALPVPAAPPPPPPPPPTCPPLLQLVLRCSCGPFLVALARCFALGNPEHAPQYVVGPDVFTRAQGGRRSWPSSVGG
jgi:hypothetical protein